MAHGLTRLQALRHSKVKLTWDQDDPNRIKLTRRNLTKDEIEEGDFKAYLASSGSEDEGSEEEEEGEAEEAAAAAAAAVKGKRGKKASKEDKEKLRALLLTGNDEDGDVWGKAGLSNGFSSKPDPKGEMEITFRPGLSVSAQGKDEENLTTLEKYQLRMKEKKARKKEKVELKRAAKEEDAPVASAAKDDFFGDSDSESEREITTKPTTQAQVDDNDEEELAKVLGGGGGGGGGVEHFSMKDILKAEKEGGKKKRKRNKKKKTDGSDEREVELGKEGWKIDTKDPRFKALHEEPEFAIDPSNPQ